MSPVAALQASACALLDADQHADARQVLASGELLLVGESETWEMGSAKVTAERLVLVLEAAELALVRARPELQGQMHQALSAAMHSGETRLRALDCCLRLPVAERPWRELYRSAARFTDDEVPDEESVLAAAGELLVAGGDAPAAGLLERCELEIGEVGQPASGSGARRLLRCVLRVPAADLVALRTDRTRVDVVRAAIADAASRPLCAVANVTLAVLAPI